MVLGLAVGRVADSLVGLAAVLPGVRVLKASGSREALDLLVRHDVAVAIVDVQMPDMSGFELAELMRGAARTRAVPIIFLTAATPEPGRVLRGDEAGGIDFLVKPVDPHLLRSKVGVFIELSRQRRLLSAQVEQLHALQRTSELLMGVLDHDLRNPLNAISLAAETLLLARPDDEMAALIARRIRAASQRMSRLIAKASTSRRCARGRGRSRRETPTWTSSAGPRRVSSTSWTSAASTAACRAILAGAGIPTAFSSST